MKRRDVIDTGSWPLAEELFARADPEFVREIRAITDADKLGNLAGRWLADSRPAVRRMLFDYLDLPLNAFRHEALVKRLFKGAEAVGDDEVMARFLVAFDRAVRRFKRPQRISRSVTVQTQLEADQLAKSYKGQGYVTYVCRNYRWDPVQRRSLEEGFNVIYSWNADVLRVRDGSAMWRPQEKERHRPYPLDEVSQRQMASRRLFSIRTRRYLRRRAWRYIRKLGKFQPERYLPAILAALKCYRDDDVKDGIALIDNWGLTHALFHNSPVLVSKPNGWVPAPGRGLSELSPAPYREDLWRAAPRALLELLREGRCRAVRQWAALMIRRDRSGVLAGLSHEELFALLAHEDPSVADLGAEVLRSLPDLTVLGIDRLLALAEAPHPDTMEIVCGLLADRLPPTRVTFAQAVRLASARPLPMARLGFVWLKSKAPQSEAECRAALGLAEAGADPLRLEFVRWARGAVSRSIHFQPEWVLEFLDSRHDEVRAEGWQWLMDDARVSESVEVWRKLLESPYEDVRLQLVAALEKRANEPRQRFDSARLDDELLRFLWASVLLNAHRGGRTKPVVIGQLVDRLTRRPEEASALLPILAVALRSVRGPEWRAGLSAVVRLAESSDELRTAVNRAFPELKLL